MKKKTGQWLIGACAALFLITLDQGTKALAVRHLKGGAIPLLPGVFELRYLENRGAAFGILQQKQALFLVLTAAVCAFLLWFFHRLPAGRRFLPLRLVSVLLFAGAVGNLIDRVRQAYVVDFLYFRLIDFPIFNVADCYVSISAVLLVFLILFHYSEEELGEILKKS